MCLQDLLGFHVPIPRIRPSRVVLTEHSGKAEYAATDAITGCRGFKNEPISAPAVDLGEVIDFYNKALTGGWTAILELFRKEAQG